MVTQAKQQALDEKAWHVEPARPIESILVPVDYSEHAFRAASIALAMAQGLRASLTLLHLRISDEAVRETVAIEREDLAAVTQERLERLMMALVSGVDEETLESIVPCSHAQVRKDAYAASAVIVEFVEAHGVDLIVMGARARARIRNMLLGDVAKRVIEDAPCPVMVLH